MNYCSASNCIRSGLVPRRWAVSPALGLACSYAQVHFTRVGQVNKFLSYLVTRRIWAKVALLLHFRQAFSSFA